MKNPATPIRTFQTQLYFSEFKINHMYPQLEISVRLKAGTKEAQINNSRDAAEVFREIFNADTMCWTEECIILCLNQANGVIGYHKLSSGGMTGTVVDPRVVFTVALKSCASKIMIAHNHPSGNLAPSGADRQITKKLKDAGNLLDIPVLDHIIMSSDGYYSFLDEGQM
jgi:DNA repair protein RadC